MTAAGTLALLGTLLALSITPGPSDVAVVARSLARGFRHGLSMTFGIVAADVIFIILALGGMSAVAEALGEFFIFIRWTCGLCLIGMGIATIRAKSHKVASATNSGAGHRSSFAAGLLITLADPKAILFYMGLLPAFVDLARVTLRDAAVIAALATIAICTVKLSYAFLAARATRWFSDARLRRRLDLTAGAVLLCTGLVLLFHV